MTKLEVAQNLKEKIKKADYEYYVLGKPSLSDAEYDRMYKEYTEYENEFPELKTIDSPTMRVGGEPLDKFEKITHSTPLLSIDQKAKTIEALLSFYENCGGDGTEVLVQPKFDGLTINAVYKNGSFESGATRGNGYIGELISENVKVIRSVPMSLKDNETFEVRGEAIVSLSNFLDEFGEEYSNPRNFIAGTMRQLDSKIVSKRKADIIFYDIGKSNKQFFSHKDTERLEWLKEQGFKITPTIVVNNAKDLVNACTSGMYGLISEDKGFNTLHKNGKVDCMIDDIVCDGIVVKVNDLNLREELGMTAKGPKWAFAYKFKSIQANTTLKNVVWQVGRTGKLTPVAEFDTVNIGGTSISRATLNNIDYINTLPLCVDSETFISNKEEKLSVNDTIIIERSNDVIPRIIGFKKGNNRIEINVPEICPICKSKIKEIYPQHFCTNISCGARLKGSLIHFVSRDAMNIDGLGKSIVDILVDNGYISSIYDIYMLKNYREKLMQMDGFGEKKVDKLLNSIEKSKKEPLEKFLFALGIEEVGKNMAKSLAKHYLTIENFMKTSYEELKKIEDVGDVVANNIYSFVTNEKNIELIQKFKDIGFSFETNNILSSDKFVGKTFVITGTLKEKRSYYQKIIEDNGGKVSGSVSPKTYAVIIGVDAGSKETKARELVAKGNNILLIEGHENFENFVK